MATGQTATLSRVTTTADAMGGQVPTWTATYSDFACNIQPRRGGLREKFDRPEMHVTHVLYTATAITAATGDRVVSGGVTYLVQHGGDTAGKSRMTTLYLTKEG